MAGFPSPLNKGMTPQQKREARRKAMDEDRVVSKKRNFKTGETRVVQQLAAKQEPSERKMIPNKKKQLYDKAFSKGRKG